MNVRKFRENSRETVPVSAICDEYCTPLGSGHYWGGGPVLFQKRGPKNFSPSQVNSPKILPPPKMCAQKIVTLPCNNILSIKMFHRENPYKRNFESIFSLE